MKHQTTSLPRHLFVSITVLLLLSCTLVGMIAWPMTPSARREMAQNLWNNRKFKSYHIALRIENLDQVCFQEMEVANDGVKKMLSDTCRTSWFSALTIGRLFEISERIEQPATCYPDLEPCACQQLRLGKITYDEHLGYPTEIAYRRSIQLNWTHPDFWKRIWERRSLPSCELTHNMRIIVTSFTPIS